MTIEITVKPNHVFDGDTVEEVINDITQYCVMQNDFYQKIVSIEKTFNSGFCVGFFNSEIEKVQSDLDFKLNEAEIEYINSLNEEDWREQESRAYWANR
jgi:hypothetical protein